MSSSSHITIFDTTLRDGEQSPGASMTLEEKCKIAHLLCEMGVDVIEAGFPVASKGDFQAVQRIAHDVKGSVICALARAHIKDIDAAQDALKPATRKRIHTFISTSALHMKHKLRMTKEEVLDAISSSVSYARRWTDDVEWSPEDGSRTDHDVLCHAVETAIKAGATTINIPDTVGYAMPKEFASLMAMVRERVPSIHKVTLSCHCHNDLGCAVANSLSAIEAGVRQVECTINGIGERAGNAALEEIVMALKTRHDLLPFSTSIDATKLTRASHLVSAITNFPVQPNKAIVGRNAFSHEAGIHQDGMLKHSGTYEIMTPESVGLSQSVIVLGKHSGRHAFAKKIEELGYGTVDEKSLNKAFGRFKELADHKKDIFEEDIIALMDDETARQSTQSDLLSLNVRYDSDSQCTTSITIRHQDETISATATANGVIDSLFSAIDKAIPHDATLSLYQVKAITQGIDAQADVTVRLTAHEQGVVGQDVVGQGIDTDTLHASARAYIQALNKLQRAHRHATSLDGTHGNKASRQEAFGGI
ncbi:MAG: 2-isopropylmalate synthase [Alphaproteobacteria bacterium GM7ARS4]|nr:2-isopropylmalate synthase [Alphaproteobacteria bacterium GM7ARS4]